MPSHRQEGRCRGERTKGRHRWHRSRRRRASGTAAHRPANPKVLYCVPIVKNPNPQGILEQWWRQWEAGWEESTEGEKETNTGAVDRRRAAAADAPDEEDGDGVADHHRNSSCFSLRRLNCPEGTV